MTVAALALGCIIFIEAFLFLELGKQARGILVNAREALRVLADPERSDEEKESCARRASRVILKITVAVVLKLAAIAVVLFALFAGAALISPQSKAGIAAALASPAVIVLLTLAGVCYVSTRNAIKRQI
jgi:hypothetical protein